MIEKKTKIICTIGPSSSSYKTLKALSEHGMNVARLNFSHGSHEEHLEKIVNIKKLREEGLNISLLLDTKGPEVRIGELEEGFLIFVVNFEMILIALQNIYPWKHINNVLLQDYSFNKKIIAIPPPKVKKKLNLRRKALKKEKFLKFS